MKSCDVVCLKNYAMRCSNSQVSKGLYDDESSQIFARMEIDMTYLLIFIVLILSMGYAIRFVDTLLMLFSYAGKSSEKSYMQLYNSMDDELYAEIIKTIPNAPNNYSEYLLLHQGKRPEAYQLFRALRSDIVKHLAFVYLVLLVVLATVSFYISWYLVVLTFLATHTVVLFDRKYVKKHDKHFYLMMMHLTILSEESSTT